MADLPILIFCGQAQRCQAVSRMRTSGCHALRQPSWSLVSHCLVRDTHTRSFCSCAHPVPPCQKEQIPVLLMVIGPSTVLSNLPGVTWNLLCALQTVLGNERHILMCHRWTICATSVESKYDIMLQVVTLTLHCYRLSVTTIKCSFYLFHFWAVHLYRNFIVHQS